MIALENIFMKKINLFRKEKFLNFIIKKILALMWIIKSLLRIVTFVFTNVIICKLFSNIKYKGDICKQVHNIFMVTQNKVKKKELYAVFPHNINKNINESHLYSTWFFVATETHFMWQHKKMEIIICELF